MRRRWFRYFLLKKYMMRCCQCKKNEEKDENGKKCFCNHHRFCGSCKIKSQEEKDKNEHENNNENSPQAIEEEEGEKE